MIGQRIEAPPGAPVGAMVCVLLAAALAAPGLVLHNRALLWVALLPALVAVAWFLGRSARFAVTFTPTGVLPDDCSSEIPYTAIQALRRFPSGVPRSTKAPRPLRGIELHYAGGSIRLRAAPGALGEICGFLLERVGLSGSRAINPALAAHLQTQIETFGAQRVYSFRSRFTDDLPARRRWSGARGRALRIGLACAIVGIVWLVAAGGELRDMFLALGILLIVGGLLTMVVSRATFGVPHKKWRDAALVVSPLGLALKLGDVIGELRWEELREIKLGGQQRDIWGTGGPIGALRLEVEGATIGIPDWFDRPVDVIYGLICHCWRGAPLPGTPPVRESSLAPGNPGIPSR